MDARPNRTLLIIGASRGLGQALAEGLPDPGDHVYTVSRSAPDIEQTYGKWIQADLRNDDAPTAIVQGLGDQPLDVLIYNAGIWETDWTDSTFDQVPAQELRDIVMTNMTSMMLSVQAVLPHLRRSNAGRVVLIGSTSGLENSECGLAGTVASKFGVRGLAHALRAICRPGGIAVTCVSPGTIATDFSLSDGIAPVLKQHGRTRIPVGDLVVLVRTVLRLSPASCVKEIHIPAMDDRDV